RWSSVIPLRCRPGDENVEIRLVTDRTRQFTRLISGPGEYVAARRSDNGAASIERQHGSRKRPAMIEMREAWRMDEERKAECVDEAIDRQGSARQKRHLGGGYRPECQILDRGFAEEDIGAIVPQYFVDLFRIAGKPGADGLHGDRCRIDLAAV